VGEEVVDDRGRVRGDVFGVVDDDQHAPVPQERRDLIAGVAAGAETEAGGLRECELDAVGVGDRDQVDEPHAVGEPIGGGASGGDGEPGLAGPTDAQQGDEPVSAEGVGHGDDVIVAAEQRGPLDRQVVADR
jgi:hypothetical protein